MSAAHGSPQPSRRSPKGSFHRPKPDRSLAHGASNRQGVWRRSEAEPHALRQQVARELEILGPLEDLAHTPGPGLMAPPHERLNTADWTGFARLAQRVSARR